MTPYTVLARPKHPTKGAMAHPTLAAVCAELIEMRGIEPRGIEMR